MSGPGWKRELCRIKRLCFGNSLSVRARPTKVDTGFVARHAEKQRVRDCLIFQEAGKGDWCDAATRSVTRPLQQGQAIAAGRLIWW